MRWKWTVMTSVVVIAGLIVVAYAVLTTYNYNNLKPQIAQAFKATTGRDLTLNGNVRLKVSYAPTLAVANVGIQNAAWGSQPEMATIKRFELQIALLPLIFGSVEVKRLILIDPDILIETNASGTSNLDFMAKMQSGKEKHRPPAKRGVQLTINELSIQNGRITYRNGKTGRTYVAMVDSLTATAANAESPIELKLKGSYQGELFQGAGTLVPLASLAHSGRAWPLDLSMNAAGANLTLAGTIKDVPRMQGIDIRFHAKSKDLQRMSQLTGEPLPTNGSLDISGRVTDPEPKIYKISALKVALDDSDLAGFVQLDVSSQRPSLTANLVSKKLDLRPLLQSSRKQRSKAVRSERPKKVFSNRPLSLGALQKADAAMNFQVTELLLPRLALRNLSAGIALRNGSLTVKPLTAVVGGGALNGHFNLQSQGKAARMETAVKIDHLNTGAMLKELAITNVLEGLVDADINLTSQGNSIAGLMAELNGKFVLQMSNGRIYNQYISLLGSDLESSAFRLINPFHEKEPYTKVECIVSGFHIKNGIAETTALVVNTNHMSVVGNGKIDLRTEKLDLNLKPIPKQGLGTSLTGKLNLSLGELARPFKLAGTLAHPSLALDLSQTGIAIGKAMGGLLLFGPAGIGGALTGSSSQRQDLCGLAVQAAHKGVKLTVLEKREKHQGVVGQTTQGVKQGVGEIGKQLKKLFGN